MEKLDTFEEMLDFLEECKYDFDINMTKDEAYLNMLAIKLTVKLWMIQEGLKPWTSGSDS